MLFVLLLFVAGDDEMSLMERVLSCERIAKVWCNPFVVKTSGVLMCIVVLSDCPTNSATLSGFVLDTEKYPRSLLKLKPRFCILSCESNDIHSSIIDSSCFSYIDIIFCFLVDMRNVCGCKSKKMIHV